MRAGKASRKRENEEEEEGNNTQQDWLDLADLALVFPPAAQKKSRSIRPPNDFDGGESSFNRALASLRTSFQAKIALPPRPFFSAYGAPDIF